MTCVSDGGSERRQTGTQRIDTVIARIGSETISFKPSNVISSIPPGLLKRFLYSQPVQSNIKPQTSNIQTHRHPRLSFSKRRATVSTRLATGDLSQHKNRPNHELCWLLAETWFRKERPAYAVKCIASARISLLELDDQSIAKLTLDDCARSGLLDPAQCFDHLVLRLPGADASQNRDNWMSPSTTQAAGRTGAVQKPLLR